MTNGSGVGARVEAGDAVGTSGAAVEVTAVGVIAETVAPGPGEGVSVMGGRDTAVGDAVGVGLAQAANSRLRMRRAWDRFSIAAPFARSKAASEIVPGFDLGFYGLNGRIENRRYRSGNRVCAGHAQPLGRFARLRSMTRPSSRGPTRDPARWDCAAVSAHSS